MKTNCKNCSCVIATGATIFLFLLLSRSVSAQKNSLPAALNPITYQSIPTTQLPPPDTAWISRQLQVTDKIANTTVAYTFKTHFTPNTDDHWQSLAPGVNSWFLKLRSADAYGLALVFSSITLLPGEALYVYNQNTVHGPYTAADIPPSGVLPVDFVNGDEVVIEYDVPVASKRHGSWAIERVSHAFRDLFGSGGRATKENAAARTASECYICLQNESLDNQRRATVKLTVFYDSTVKICTGTLMNNTARDNRPYVLTAQHCVTGQFDADRTIFAFGFEDIDCVGFTQREDQTLYGSRLRASVFENDFSLLELHAVPPPEFHPYYAGWDISDQYRDAVTCVHHPQGGAKEVSVSNGAVVTSNFDDGASRAPLAFWNVKQWDVGATEGGSSGAALFNKNSEVIGTLSGGSSACGTPYNDYFGKLSVSWQALPEQEHQLKYWLDPVLSGTQSLTGKDPYEDSTALPPQETVISLYPNPATDAVIVRLPDHASTLLLEVFDLQGRQQEAPYNVYENSVVLATASLGAGVYVVKLATAQGVYQAKFVKR
jgi:hypothetical protein